MEPKLLLVKAITLLYRESQIYVAGDNSADLVKTIVESIKIPENTMEGDRNREILISLRTTAMWMAENPPQYDYDKNILLQRIRINTGYETGLYEAFESGLYEVETDEEIKKICLEYRDILFSYMNRDKVKDILKKASQKVMFQEEAIDWRSFVADTVSELEPYITTQKNAAGAGDVDSVNFEDLEKLEEMFKRASDELSSEGTLRTGWQAINRMTGEHDGFRRGECVVIGALQHNFKTGFTLSIFKQWALYNKPYMRDPKKKPLLIHLSLENNLTDNLMWLYVNLKEQETGEPCDVNSVDKGEVALYVKQRLEATGYHIHMCRKNPSDFSYYDFVDMVNYFESEGYEIHGIVCDYLNMMNKKGCDSSGPTGSVTRDLFRRVRNLCSPKAIAFLTPAQLSTEAKSLVRQGIQDFVQEIANKGYYDSCKTIDQEVDMEIYIHIEKVGEESYLTVQRGKHRKLRPTPQKDLYTVLKFEPVGSVIDDIEGKDLSRRKVGGSAMGDGGSVAWWDTDNIPGSAPI